MAAVPRYRLGRHLTAITLVGQDIANNGTLSDNASGSATVNCLAVIDTMRSSLRSQKEEINASTSTRENSVNTADGQSLRIDIIEVNNGTDPTPLEYLWLNFDIIKVSWTVGTVTSFRRAKVGYYSRGDYEDGQAGRGRQIASITLDPADAGASSFSSTMS